MNILLIFPGFILAFIIVLCDEYKIRNLSAKPKNNVHFYVSKDENGFLALWLGKPLRAKNQWVNDIKISTFITNKHGFYRYGLNQKDYKNLQWDDEPIEVFLNLED